MALNFKKQYIFEILIVIILIPAILYVYKQNTKVQNVQQFFTTNGTVGPGHTTMTDTANRILGAYLYPTELRHILPDDLIKRPANLYQVGWALAQTKGSIFANIYTLPNSTTIQTMFIKILLIIPDKNTNTSFAFNKYMPNILKNTSTFQHNATCNKKIIDVVICNAFTPNGTINWYYSLQDHSLTTLICVSNAKKTQNLCK